MSAINQYRRATAWEINSFPKRSRGITNISGDGATVPIIYGRDSVAGYKFAEQEYGGYLYIGILWGLGPIYSVKLVEMNDAPMPSGVQVRHYLGNVSQGVDSWLAAAIPGYDDDLVFVLPGGSAPAAYSVFKIASGALDGVPRIRAIIQGKLVNDPDAAANSDPNYNNCGIIVDFENGGLDTSQYAHTISLVNGATVNSGGLQLDGTNDYASFKSHPSLDVTNEEFCIELVVTADDALNSPKPLQTILTNTPVSSPSRNSIRLDLSGTDLLLYLSTNGTSWDLANGVDVGNVTTSKFYFTLERVGNELITFVNGVETWRLAAVTGSPETASSIYSHTTSPSTITWYLGQFNGGQYFDGKIHSLRIMVGDYRYGSNHTATATPFADSGSYGARDVYSTNPALCWADMASSDLYGLGATVSGLSEAATWCDSLLDNGESRCKLSYTITSARRVEDWLDLLATYADCVWLPEGANLRIQPDDRQSSDDPSGLDVVRNGVFNAQGSPQEWVLGTGWTVGSGVLSRALTSPQAIANVTQTMTTEAGIVYALSITLSSRTSGSVSVEVGGVSAIAAQTVAGTYTAFVTPTGTSTQLKIIGSAGCILSVDNVSFKRQAYKEEKWVKSSLSISGPSERDTPTSVITKYTAASSTTANWNEASVVRTLPAASAGTIPFIQTTLDMPGLHDEDKAGYQAVKKLQRMYRRLDVSYITTDHAVMHRVGDTIELVNAFRGASATIWVDDVETIGYGRYRVTGVLYSLLHFPDSDQLDFFQSDSYLIKLVETVESGSNGGVWILDEVGSSDDAVDETSFGNTLPNFGTMTTGGTSFMDDGRTSTVISGSVGYRQTSSAPWIQLTGCMGMIFDKGDSFSFNLMRIEFKSSTNHQIYLSYLSSTQIDVVMSSITPSVTETYTGTGFNAAHVFYLNYQLSGTSYSIELFIDFVSQGVRTGTVPAAWAIDATPEFYVGAISGSGNGNAQYAFCTDFWLTSDHVAELELAYNRNFEDYVPAFP